MMRKLARVQESYFFYIGGLLSSRDMKLLEPLKTVAANSPMLENLIVDFKNIPMTLEHMISSLGTDFTLPRLKTFHLGGCLDPSPEDIDLPKPSSHGASHFQAFLSRHPRLNELKLDCPFFHEFHKKFDPAILAQGLPMLLAFSGPRFIYEQLLYYPIAQQIRGLSIGGWNWESGRPGPEKGSTDKLHLPELRSLEIQEDNVPKAMEILETVLPAAAGLESLYTPAMPHNYHKDFLVLLTHTPKLQDICLWNYDSDFNGKDAPVPSGFNRIELVVAMKDMFPDLEIECLGDWD
ncbi:hypothetical protein RSOLAG22IIIB_09053 [Rhizoctonia solani]|uniref:Uncharacterized protein n=1 Tax=Rhizoctonia solani TaxID=456999 RepID=A0A0K6FWU1_9AGAM|nr:hypothetical protein RSOLAG22IIIB_09053 [Rhizoctonia solani]